MSWGQTHGGALCVLVVLNIYILSAKNKKNKKNLVFVLSLEKYMFWQLQVNVNTQLIRDSLGWHPIGIAFVQQHFVLTR